MSPPKSGFIKNLVNLRQGVLQGDLQSAQEPHQPCGDIQGATLGRLQNPVVVAATLQDRSGHRVQANIRLIIQAKY
jgi:hypothetical protein